MMYYENIPAAYAEYKLNNRESVVKTFILGNKLLQVKREVQSKLFKFKLFNMRKMNLFSNFIRSLSSTFGVFTPEIYQKDFVFQDIINITLYSM